MIKKIDFNTLHVSVQVNKPQGEGWVYVFQYITCIGSS